MSSFSNYISEEKHKFSEDGVKIVQQKKSKKLDIVESMRLEIHKNLNKGDLLVLNAKENQHNSPVIDIITTPHLPSSPAIAN